MKLKLVVVHLGFALTGIVTTMLGPLLPLLSAQWALNDAQAGHLFVAQFIASVAGSLIASLVLARWGAGWTVPIGMFLIAAGVLALGAKSLIAGIAGISIFGIGLGFALPSTNLLVAELLPASRVAALNFLNFAWTGGALAAPLAISGMLKPFGLTGFLVALAVAFFIIAAIETKSFPAKASVVESVRKGKIQSGRRVQFALYTAVFLFLYVGVENGFAGWISAFSVRTQNTSQFLTALLQSSFWVFLLLGRLLAPLVVRTIAPQRLIIFSLVSAVVGITIAISSPTTIVLACGIALCGLSLAAIFPTVVAIFTEWYGTGGAGSIVLGTCGLGGALIPWLIGFVSLHADSLRIGLAVTLACILLAMGIFQRIVTLAQTAAAHSAK